VRTWVQHDMLPASYSSSSSTSDFVHLISLNHYDTAHPLHLFSLPEYSSYSTVSSAVFRTEPVVEVLVQSPLASVYRQTMKKSAKKACIQTEYVGYTATESKLLRERRANYIRESLSLNSSAVSSLFLSNLDSTIFKAPIPDLFQNLQAEACCVLVVCVLSFALNTC